MATEWAAPRRPSRGVGSFGASSWRFGGPGDAAAGAAADLAIAKRGQCDGDLGKIWGDFKHPKWGYRWWDIVFLHNIYMYTYHGM